MTIIFDDEINVDTVEKFCIDLDSVVRGLEDGETVDLYISTNGGSVAHMHILINGINKHADRLVIYLTDIMWSCGFLILWYMRNYNLYAFPSFRETMIHNIGIIHNTSSEHFTRRSNEVKQMNKVWYARLKELGLTKKQLKRYKASKDVYFTREEVLKLFPNIIEVEHE